MNHHNLQQPATKEDLEIAIAQICKIIIKSQANFVTKDDLRNFATKDDLKAVHKDIIDIKGDIVDIKEDIVDIKADVSDIKRRVIDLETDTPTKKEFEDLKTQVASIQN